MDNKQQNTLPQQQSQSNSTPVQQLPVTPPTQTPGVAPEPSIPPVPQAPQTPAPDSSVSIDAQLYPQGAMQQGTTPSTQPSEVSQRIASWYEPSTDVPLSTQPAPTQVESTPIIPGQEPVTPPTPQPITPEVAQSPSGAASPWEIPASPVSASSQDVPLTPIAGAEPEQAPQQEMPVTPSPIVQPEQTAPQKVVEAVPQVINAPSQGSVPPKSPVTPPASPFHEESHHGLVPKPLKLILGVLAVLVVLFFVVKLVGGLFHGGSSGKVTLTYWGLWEDNNVMQSVISDFERENSNIHVNYIKEDPKEYNQRVLTRIQDGNGPDIFRYHATWLPEMLPALLPFSKDVISKDDLTKNYYPFIRNDIVKNGAVYGLPLEIDTLAMYVNTDLFDKAKVDVPSTWDNFITVARGLTEKDASGKIQVAGASIGTFDNITHAPDLVSLLLVQNGVDLASMSPAQNASDALTFYTSFAKDQTSIWDDTLDPSQLGFARGNIAMYFGYSWDVFAIKAANPNLNFKIYPVPHLPGRDTTIASYWVEGISSKTKHPKEAMLFMKYLARKDTLTKLHTEEAKTRLFGELYPRIDLADSLKDNPLAVPFVSQSKNAMSSFFAGETHDTGINAQMNGYLGNAVRSVLKDTSPDTAIETLTKGVSTVLQQYGQTQQQQ